jgi:hypothetical protein
MEANIFDSSLKTRRLNSFMNDFQHLAQFVAGFCCGIFAGAAVYVSIVEHPARMACGTAAAAKFRPSYKRAAIMQATPAALSFISSGLAWPAGAGIWWLIGGILQCSVIPFTLIFIMPTNNELLAPSLDKESDRTNELLSRWGHLHAVRSALATPVLLIFLLRLISR